MNEFARLSALAKRLRETYKRGTRIVLNHMGSDPRPIPDGSRGTVVGVDDIGSIMVKWDCGRGLSLIYGEDSFRPLTQEEIAEESAPKKTREFIGRLNRDVFPQVSTEKLKAFEDAGDTWYITSGIDEKTARLIILHEEAHIGRGDHIWKPLGFLILCVYRFDSLIWLVYIIFCMDIEHCLGFKMSFRAKKYAPAAPR